MKPLLPSKEMIAQAKKRRAVPYWSPAEKQALDYSELQQERARKSAAPRKSARILLEAQVQSIWQALTPRQRQKPTSKATITAVQHELSAMGVEATDTQIKRTLHNLTKIAD